MATSSALAAHVGAGLRRHQLRLGNAVNAGQRGLLDADVLADDFRRDSGVTEPQGQRVWQRQFAECALVSAEFIGHPISLRPEYHRGVSKPLLEFWPIRHRDT
jgi:hypothetical protein